MSKRKQNKENASVSEDNNQFKKKVNKIGKNEKSQLIFF